MFIGNINVWVLLLATFVGMSVGFVWYAPWAFGKLWLQSKGWSDETLRNKKEGKPMWPVFLASTIATLITALVLAVLFNSLVILGIWNMTFAAVLLWIGLIVPVKLGDYLFGGDTFTFFLIAIGHYLVSTVLMSLIIGIFG